MGFDDIFENSYKRNKHGRYNPYGHDDHDKHGHYSPYDHDDHDKHGQFSPFGHDDHDKHGQFSPFGHDDHYRGSGSHHGGSDMKIALLSKLRDNPKLRALLVTAGIILIAIIILLIVLLFPLLTKLIDMISQNGIKGIIDSIWSGSK